jgi:tripartite-type tricarboxylate transporter receptor subunit TctC
MQGIKFFATQHNTTRIGDTLIMKPSLKLNLLCIALFASAHAGSSFAQTVACPEKSVQYIQAFPPGGESDLSARHQQKVLKAKCPNIDTVVQYKAGAGGALLWNQFNQLAADGVTVGGVNLPHIVFQPLEGQVQYKTADITPVYWFHYTPDILVVPVQSNIKTFKDFIANAKSQPGKISLGGSGQNSANHAAHERMNAAFGVKTIYIPYKGTGDMATAVLGAQIDGAMTYTPFAINNKEKVRALAVAMEKRHPLLPDVPTFRELGVDWVDGAYRGIGMPKSASADQRKKMSDLWRALNTDVEMKDLAAKNGFELVNIGVEQMDAFMAEKTKLYTEAAKRLDFNKK